MSAQQLTAAIEGPSYVRRSLGGLSRSLPFGDLGAVAAILLGAFVLLTLAFRSVPAFDWRALGKPEPGTLHQLVWWDRLTRVAI